MKGSNIYRMKPNHCQRYAGTWVEGIATDLFTAEVWERMTDGGIQVNMPRPVSLAYVNRKHVMWTANPPYRLTIIYAAR